MERKRKNIVDIDWNSLSLIPLQFAAYSKMYRQKKALLEENSE